MHSSIVRRTVFFTSVRACVIAFIRRAYRITLYTPRMYNIYKELKPKRFFFKYLFYVHFLLQHDLRGRICENNPEYVLHGTRTIRWRCAPRDQHDTHTHTKHSAATADAVPDERCVRIYARKMNDDKHTQPYENIGVQASQRQPVPSSNNVFLVRTICACVHAASTELARASLLKDVGGKEEKVVRSCGLKGECSRC